MELISDKSQQVPIGELELFAAPFTQTSVSEDILTQHRPVATLSADHPIEFVIQSGINEYINLRETIFYLRLHFELSRSDGSNIGEGDWTNFNIVNNLLHSIFESVSMHIGENPVNSSNSTYPYRAWFDWVMNSGDEAANTYGQACLFDYEKGSTGKGLFKPDTIGGASCKTKSVELAGKLHLDLSFQDRALLGGSTIKIKLIPHKPSFYLNYTDKKLQVKPVFDDAYLETHRSKVFDPIVEAHSAALQISSALYPIQRVEVRSHLIAKNSLNAYIDHAVIGILPRRIYVGLLANDSFNGTNETDPFKFQNFDLSYIATYYNASMIPNQPYKPNYEEKKYLREYMGLFSASNQLYYNTKCLIKREDYPENYCLYGFNFSPDLSDGCNSTGHASLIKRGNLRIEMHFKKALTKTVSAIIFSEYDSIIQINADRNGSIEL